MSVLQLIDTVLGALQQPALKGDALEESLPLSMLKLKILNRQTMLELEKQESTVNEQKDKNDSNRLRLENLLYRKAYLAREIKACKDFTPSEVLAVEAETKSSLVQDTFTSDLATRHRESLASLAAEFQERQRIQELLAKLKAQHSTETQELDKKMKFLEELPGKLDAVLAGATSLEGVLRPQDQISCRDAHLQRARRLPGPLYVLYHALHNVNPSLSPSDPTPCAAGYSLLLRRAIEQGNSYGTKWMYRVEVIDGEASQPHIELHLRIEVEIPVSGGTEATQTESASAILNFNMHPDADTTMVGVAMHSLSFHSACPFKPEGLLHALYPHDEGEVQSTAQPHKSADSGKTTTLSWSYFIWAQWISGLRPVPSRADIDTKNSTGAVLHRVFSRLQSHWRLSNQLQCLEQKKVYPLPPALHLPYVATVNSVPYANTIAPPAGLCSAPASLYPFTKHTGSQVTPKSAPGTVSAAAIRSFQRAEAPPLSSFTMDPYRYLRELPTETGGQEGTMECEPARPPDNTIEFTRGLNDRRHCAYYKIALDLPKELSATPAMALLEISPEYPLRPPQIVLTSRLSALGPNATKATDDGKAGAQLDNALKALECELNAGCLGVLLGAGLGCSGDNTAMAIASVEDTMDATLSFQIGLLLSLIVVNSLSAVPPGTAGAPSRKRGRNRRAAAVQGLYGRQPF